MVGRAWIGRAKHKSSRAWRLRRGRDRGRRVVKDRGAREREEEGERDVGAGGDGGTAGGSEKKSECGWRGGEERSAAVARVVG